MQNANNQMEIGGKVYLINEAILFAMSDNGKPASREVEIRVKYEKEDGTSVNEIMPYYRALRMAEDSNLKLIGTVQKNNGTKQAIVLLDDPAKLKYKMNKNAKGKNSGKQNIYHLEFFVKIGENDLAIKVRKALTELITKPNTRIALKIKIQPRNLHNPQIVRNIFDLTMTTIQNTFETLAEQHQIKGKKLDLTPERIANVKVPTQFTGKSENIELQISLINT